MDAISRFQVQGFTVEIFADSDIESPRKEGDNFGHFVCWHRRYELGDAHEFETPAAYREFASAKANEVAVEVPVYLYDHSGLTVNTTGFSCPWDSGQIGYVYATKADVRENFLVKRVTKKILERAREVLVAEVAEFDQYLRGDVYYYVITDPSGEHVDSCGGFYGFEYAKTEALSSAREIVDSTLEAEANSAGDVPDVREVR